MDDSEKFLYLWRCHLDQQVACARARLYRGPPLDHVLMGTTGGVVYVCAPLYDRYFKDYVAVLRREDLLPRGGVVYHVGRGLVVPSLP